MSRNFQPECPFPDSARTGRQFVTACCTAATVEFEVNGVRWLAFTAAGHGWRPASRGDLDDINDTGFLCGPGNVQRAVRYSHGIEMQRTCAFEAAALLLRMRYVRRFFLRDPRTRDRWDMTSIKDRWYRRGACRPARMRLGRAAD